MSATSAMISQVRAWVGDLTLTDVSVRSVIERHARLDLAGREPFEVQSGEPNEDWDPTYDLHLAAADLLEEKAAQTARDFDFGTESERFQLSQRHAQLLSLARHHRARRMPHTSSLAVWPPEGSSC